MSEVLDYEETIDAIEAGEDLKGRLSETRWFECNTPCYTCKSVDVVIMDRIYIYFKTSSTRFVCKNCCPELWSQKPEKVECLKNDSSS